MDLHLTNKLALITGSTKGIESNLKWPRTDVIQCRKQYIDFV